jgi:hypothetical protein
MSAPPVASKNLRDHGVLLRASPSPPERAALTVITTGSGLLICENPAGVDGARPGRSGACVAGCRNRL